MNQRVVAGWALTVAVGGLALLAGSNLYRREHRRAELKANDEKIQQELGIRCDTFETNQLLGLSRERLNRLMRLESNVLRWGDRSTIDTGAEEAEFRAEVNRQVDPQRQGTEEQVNSQVFIVCDLQVVLFFYGEQVEDVVYIPKEKKGHRIFGIDQ